MPFSGFLKPKPDGGKKPMVGKQIITPGSTNAPISFGFHDGTGYSSGVVVPVAKVANDTTIAGQTGTMPNNSAETKALAILTLQNLITNGSFENGVTGWTANGAEISISTTQAKFGTSSEYVNANSSNNSYYSESPALIANHKYYQCAWVYLASYTSGDGTCLYSGGGTATSFNPTKLNQWQFVSSYGSTVSPSNEARIGHVFSNAAQYQGYMDGHVLIDLTATFGAGNEPTQAQMDALVTAMGGWFDGSTLIGKLPNGAFITNGASGTPDVLLNDASLIPSNVRGIIFGVIGTCKQSASGSVTSSSSSVPCTESTSAITNAYTVSVSGLTFTPSAITVTSSDNHRTTYAIEKLTTVPTKDYYVNEINAGLNYDIWLDGTNLKVVNGSFILPFPVGNVACTYEAKE